MSKKLPVTPLLIFIVSLTFTLAVSPAIPVPAAEQPVVTWPTIALQSVQSGYSSPVHMASAGDGSGRLFVVEQGGYIRILQNGLQAPPFLDIHGRVRSPDSTGGSEEGLLSVAFPPGFGDTRHHFYVYYTNMDGNNQVSRFEVSADPDQADPGSEKRIILFEHPGQANHNGGQLAFGADGYLYIGTGDGGGGGDPLENAQNPAVLLGKLLRIDVEMIRATAPGLDHRLYLPLALQNGANPQFYRIPEDNPFVQTPGYLPEIWALGLRNPWRFAFDRTTHDLYLGDVGQGDWEELDFQPASSVGGENYGWDFWEGLVCFSAGCDPAGMNWPIHVYSHADGDCSVTAGNVYRGDAFPQMQGIYFFGDYCTGRLWGLQPDGADWAVHEFTDTIHRISSFAEDESGELYLISLNGGIYHITVP